MNPFLQFVSHFRQALLLWLYIVLSFLLILSSESRVAEGLRSTSLHLIGTLDEMASSVGNYFYLSEENRQLRKENTRLAYENFQLQDALLENIRLRKILRFSYSVDYDLLPAKVVGFSPQSQITGLLLSSDNMQSIKKNSAVMTADGLVGKIVKLSGRFAIAQILFDANIRVSARVQRNRELGLIKWDGARGLLLDQVANTVRIEVGDVVYTSGMSQIYPPNIKIGVVSEVQEQENVLFQRIRVIPSVNFDALDEVLIYREMPR
ncbi:MAG TPA: rod shape-determining protein MreC [Caldithrix abyssi]|uniref:Cell shape-determining protein MreC n=1 Tax=Caldithrix abyssi TaxID=187145 RepID=A0A7V1LQ98_CALAY|nr:rod shape-determining protein MreC [Caldithrix abyssi]